MKHKQLNLFPKPPRAYVVSVYGYGEAQYTATTAGKARAMAYRAFCDATGKRDFLEFLIESRVWRARSDGGAA
jgi:hypothetical protein